MPGFHGFQVRVILSESVALRRQESKLVNSVGFCRANSNMDILKISIATEPDRIRKF